MEVYLPAQLYLSKQGQDHIIPMEVKARGNSRRQFCHFPPMKLKFFDSWLEKEGLANFTDLKLVSHCRQSIDYRDVVLREYLVYKMLSILTDDSFRTQLLRVEFVDFRQEKNIDHQYAMILESVDQLADRLQGKVIEQRGLLSQFVPQEELTFIALFQYFIGNTDWELDRQHNIKYIKCPKVKKLKAIPYDFDVSGIVNAAYAIPASHLPIKHVQERLFLGKCVSLEEFENALLPFRQHKEELLTIIENFEPLSLRQRKKMLKFLDSFYRAIEKEGFIKKQLMANCK